MHAFAQITTSELLIPNHLLFDVHDNLLSAVNRRFSSLMSVLLERWYESAELLHCCPCDP